MKKINELVCTLILIAMLVDRLHGLSIKLLPSISLLA